jgi:hypothetical protein
VDGHENGVRIFIALWICTKLSCSSTAIMPPRLIWMVFAGPTAITLDKPFQSFFGGGSLIGGSFVGGSLIGGELGSSSFGGGLGGFSSLTLIAHTMLLDVRPTDN